jgi:hypothetical protein
MRIVSVVTDVRLLKVEADAAQAGIAAGQIEDACANGGYLPCKPLPAKRIAPTTRQTFLTTTVPPPESAWRCRRSILQPETDASVLYDSLPRPRRSISAAAALEDKGDNSRRTGSSSAF